MAASLSEEHGPPVPTNLPTCWQKFRDLVDNHPQDLALVSMHQPAGLYGIENVVIDNQAYQKQPYLRWDYQNLGRAVDRLSTGLQHLGAQAGMALITFMPNCVERMLAVLAADKLGCPFTAISPKNLINMEETAHMLKLCKTNASKTGMILIAQDTSLVEQINTLVVGDSAIKLLVNGEATGWTSMGTVMKVQEHHRKDSFTNGRSESSTQGHEPNDESVFFTSGTTNLPKGCRWAHPQLSCVFAAKQSIEGFAHGDRWACVMPNSHGYANAMSIIAICSGTAIIYPSEAFEPQLMFSALVEEQVTHVSLVPTMVTALCAIKEATGDDLAHLKSIMVGGAVVSPLVIKQSLENLGAEAFENAYGMTDGVFLTLGAQSNPDAYIDGEEVAVGKALPGCGIKICAREDVSTPLPRNQTGELHYTGILNCDGYVGMGLTDDWYVDNKGIRWFKTGDQARMDEQGRVFVIGRYKDIVIRGGKNLACTAMEANLAKNPRLVPFNVQVVAAPDDFAGEVPVAVTEITASPDLVVEIQKTLRDTMGREYVPDEVISAEELGLTTYPRTILGKVKKEQIAKLVKEYRTRHDLPQNKDSDTKMAAEVREIWARSVGLPADRLTDDAALTDFADSITVMRVRDKMKRQTGRNLTIVEIAEAGTIGNIIKLLEARAPEEAEMTRQRTVHRKGPPSAEDMEYLVDDLEMVRTTKNAIINAVSSYGFRWNDVQDVMPAYDFNTVMASTGVMDSWNFKFAILPSHKFDKQSVRRAIEAFIRVNPLAPSFLVWDKEALGSELALHVTMKAGQKLMDAVVHDAGSVKTVEDLKNVAFKYPHPDHSRFPGPLIRFLLFDIEENGSCGFVFNVNHAIIDASYGQILLDDIDRALYDSGNPNKALVPHPDYKIWADSYFALRSSPEARRAVKWHFNRLKNLDSHKEALWPTAPTRVPYTDADFSGPDGVQYTFEAAGIREFRQKYRNVTAPIFLKAALALINVRRTNHTHALFANLEAARTVFPFIPRAMADSGQYEATEVAGPCFESVINLIEIRPDETSAAFLQRMQEDQTNLTKYASAPWREIMSALGDAGHFLPDVTQSQIYNWVPGMGTSGTNPYHNFEALAAVVRPQVGIAVNCGMGGSNGDTMFLHVRGDSLSDAEMLQLAKQLERVTLAMVDKSNWDRPLSHILDTFSSD